MKYRRRKDRDTWHFCLNCSNFPEEDYFSYGGEKEKPDEGELCDECQAKDREGNCEANG